MRVLVDAMLLGGRHSGVEVAIEGLCAGLGRVAGEVEVLVAHRAAYDSGALARCGTETRAAAPWANSRAGRIAWEWGQLPRLGREWGADVLHAPGYVLPSGWRGPSVLTVYDLLAVTHPEWCKRSNAAYFGLTLARSIRRADIVIAPSENVRGEILERMGTEAGKVRAVPLGISEAMEPASEQRVAAARQRHGLQKPYLLWVGNIEPKKNLEGTILAFELAAREIRHDLVLVGRTAWRARPAS